MTGPAYPPGPFPDSNAIGRFKIGVSPIGTIAPFNFWQTIISQYANSEIITTLLSDFNDSIDQTRNMETFFDDIWNVNTAQGYGLDVWGRIVGVQRVLQIVGTLSYFGFQEAGIGVENFGPGGLGSFYNGDPTTSNFTLSDSAFRTLIFAKALANITDGSVKAINQILLNLFPNRGNCFVTDGLDMTMTYSFAFILTPVELAIVQQSGVLPKPVGVQATVVQL